MTATKIAKPSIQASFLSSESWAVPVSKPMDSKAATNSILKVKSSKASQNNLKKPGGSLTFFSLLPYSLFLSRSEF